MPRKKVELKAPPKGWDTGLHRASICLACARAYGGCCWSEYDAVHRRVRFKPVPGWKAEKVIRVPYKGYPPDESYRVLACPLFIPEKTKRKDGRWI